jgi:hypothetical protein
MSQIVVMTNPQDIDASIEGWNDWDKHKVDQAVRYRPSSPDDDDVSVGNKVFKRFVNVKGILAHLTHVSNPLAQPRRLFVHDCTFYDFSRDETLISEERRKKFGGGSYHGDAIAVYGGRIRESELLVEHCTFEQIGAGVISLLVQGGTWSRIWIRNCTFLDCAHSPLIDLSHPEDSCRQIVVENCQLSKLHVQGHRKAVQEVKVIGSNVDVAFPKGNKGQRCENVIVKKILRCPTCGQLRQP